MTTSETDDTMHALAKIIRERYNMCPVHRYPTEDSLASFILEKAGTRGLSITMIDSSNERRET